MVQQLLTLISRPLEAMQQHDGPDPRVVTKRMRTPDPDPDPQSSSFSTYLCLMSFHCRFRNVSEDSEGAKHGCTDTLIIPIPYPCQGLVKATAHP